LLGNIDGNANIVVKAYAVSSNWTKVITK